MLKPWIWCRARPVLSALPTKVQRRLKRTSSEAEASPLRRLLKDSSGFGEFGQTGELRWATEPYAARPPEESPSQPQDEQTDPTETAVLLFPGQGSQFVGMGRQLDTFPAAKELYELASTVVGWDVARVCREGPEEELDKHCQTCVVVTALAALERAREERPGALERVRVAAGFSLGEITALVWAGALPLEGALRLIELRTTAMRAAAADRPGGLLTLWLAPDANLPKLLRLAEERALEEGVVDPVCRVANYLYAGCRVVGGDEAALRVVEREGGSLGVRRTARVRAEGAFHTPLMARAAEAVAAAARAIGPQRPRVRVMSAVDGHQYGDGAHVARQLGRHVVAPVRWEQTLHAMYARPHGDKFPLTLALGPGVALRSTLRQVNARAWDSSLLVAV